jgi:hypothetical protein
MNEPLLKPKLTKPGRPNAAVEKKLKGLRAFLYPS